tara:strand:- start:29277 stop:29507 length:231 start_codon:yes stop_codon:yes gene_type:complete
MQAEVSDFIKALGEDPVCLECIGATLELHNSPDLALAVFAIIGQSEFESAHGTCSRCEHSRRIVRHRPRELQSQSC